MDRSPFSLTVASAVLALLVVVIWMGAPIVPSVVGAAAAAAYLIWRDRKRRGS